jgi:MFS family permease
VNFVALGALAVPSVAAIPVAVDDLTSGVDRAAALAHVLAWGAGVAVVSNPLFGYLSDRTQTRWGARRPWMILGALLCVIASAIMAGAPSLLVLTTGWALLQAGANAVMAAGAALLSDTVPGDRRALASGLFSAAAFLGTVPALVLAAVFPRQLDLVVMGTALTALAVVIACCALVQDGPAQRTAGQTSPPAAPRGSLIPFAAVWAQRLLQGLAFSLVTSLTLYLVADRMLPTGTPALAATSVTSVSTVVGGGAIVVGALVIARWGRRWRMTTFLLWGGLGLAAAAVLRAFAIEPAGLWASSALGGLSFGWFVAANFAVALQLTPHGLGGRYLGALNVAETIPQLVAPFAAAAILAWGNDAAGALPDGYAALYLAAAALSLGALPLVRLVGRHVGDAEREAPRRQGT